MKKMSLIVGYFPYLFRIDKVFVYEKAAILMHNNYKGVEIQFLIIVIILHYQIK